MSRLIRPALGLLLLAGIVALVRWLAGSWLAFVAWGYVAGSLLLCSLFAFGLWMQRAGRQSPVDELVTAIRRGIHDSQGSVKRARIVAGNVLVAIALAIAWPFYAVVLVFAFIAAISTKGGGSLITRVQALCSLYPLTTLFSLVSLLAALGIAGLFDLGLASLETARTVQIGILVVMLSWGLGLLIGPWQLMEQIRRTQGNPYIRFVVIALSMVGAFTISFTAIELPSGWLSFQALFKTGREMLSFSDVFDRNALTMTEGLRAGAGFLTYAVTLRGIWEFSNFERTSEDLIILAHKLAIAGRPARALEYLSKVENVDHAYLIARICVLLGLGDVTGAMAASRQVSELAKAGGKTYGNPYQECLGVAIVVSTPNVQLALLSNWVSNAAEDVDLCASLGTLLYHLDAKQLRPILSEHSTPEEHPLSHARVLWAGDDDDERAAMEILEKMSPPQGLGGVLRIAMQLRHHGLHSHASEESATVYRDAMTTLIPDLSTRITEIDSGIHRLQAFGELLSLHVWFTKMLPEFSEVLLPYVSALEQTLLDDPLTKRMVQAEKAGQRKMSHILNRMQS